MQNCILNFALKSLKPRIAGAIYMKPSSEVNTWPRQGRAGHEAKLGAKEDNFQWVSCNNLAAKLPKCDPSQTPMLYFLNLYFNISFFNISLFKRGIIFNGVHVKIAQVWSTL